MKKDRSVLILFTVFFLGMSLLLYPFLANFWNQKTQSHAVEGYEKILQEKEPGELETMLSEAEEYNRKLSGLTSPLVSYEKVPGYFETLDPAGTGVMGYITISKIGVELPIYHGTTADILQCAAGHLQGSSLPVGGKGTHCVLSAHRGLPSAKLFTDLDELVEGDIFVLTVLDKDIAYEVDQIRIVTPREVTELTIDENEDRCTLITCTPYGINSHRMLVRGTRTDKVISRSQAYIANEVYRVEPMIIASIVSIPMFLVLLIYILVRYRK